jgi:hypothetical protein
LIAIRSRRIAAAAALLAAVVPAGVQAASGATGSGNGGSFILLGTPGSGKVIRDTTVPFTAMGALTVTFHGDPAAGCAPRGDCGYSGTSSWSAAPGGQLSVLKIRSGHRLHYVVSAVDFGGAFGPSTPTAASVTRTSATGASGRCVDAGSANTYTSLASSGHRTVTFQLLQRGGTQLTTRCAGPTNGDLAAFSPRVTIPVATALHGKRTVDLRTSRSFTADGYTGVIDSTVVLRLGKPSVQKQSSTKFPKFVKTRLNRIVTESLNVTRVSGGLQAGVTGVANAEVCAVLDACAATGTISLALGSSHGFGSLFTVGPASKPKSVYLGALGLGRPTTRHPPTVYGSLDAGAGSASETVTQASGTCHGSTRLQDSYVVLGVRGTRIETSYQSFSSLRDECPGPSLLGKTLAVGSAPRAILRQRTFTLHLKAAGPITDDGYVIRLSGGLSITVRRGAVHQQVQRQPF